MAPLTRNRAPDAIPTALMATYYTQRASAGLLITEATAISQQGQGYADVPGLYGRQQLDGWRRVTDSVHAAGGKIVVQLWHVGRISHTRLQPDQAAPVAPSAIAAHAQTALIEDGVARFVPTSAACTGDRRAARHRADFPATAARNAIDLAGFDGVEIHGANGYLLDQFLKSGSNQRRTPTAAPSRNRCRLHLEVVRAVTDEIGGGRTGIRLSPVTPANDAYDAPSAAVRASGAPSGGAGPGLCPHHRRRNRRAARQWPTSPSTTRASQGLPASRRQGAWMVNNGYGQCAGPRSPGRRAPTWWPSAGPILPTPTWWPPATRRPVNAQDPATYYGGGAKGYTDYPRWPERPRLNADAQHDAEQAVAGSRAPSLANGSRCAAKAASSAAQSCAFGGRQHLLLLDLHVVQPLGEAPRPATGRRCGRAPAARTASCAHHVKYRTALGGSSPGPRSSMAMSERSTADTARCSSRMMRMLGWVMWRASHAGAPPALMYVNPSSRHARACLHWHPCAPFLPSAWPCLRPLLPWRAAP
jgi:N-ethylmaleimide reductase